MLGEGVPHQDGRGRTFLPLPCGGRAQVISDRETGRSRGFGFVEMNEGAEQAVEALNGAMFQGRTLTVNEAKPREERPRTGSGSGGGYGGGSRGRSERRY